MSRDMLGNPAQQAAFAALNRMYWLRAFMGLIIAVVLAAPPLIVLGMAIGKVEQTKPPMELPMPPKTVRDLPLSEQTIRAPIFEPRKLGLWVGAVAVAGVCFFLWFKLHRAVEKTLRIRVRKWAEGAPLTAASYLLESTVVMVRKRALLTPPRMALQTDALTYLLPRVLAEQPLMLDDAFRVQLRFFVLTCCVGYSAFRKLLPPEFVVAVIDVLVAVGDRDALPHLARMERMAQETAAEIAIAGAARGAMARLEGASS